jgi:hypothetical protein
MRDDVVSGQVQTYAIDTTQVFATTAICRGEIKINAGEDANVKIIETGILYSENEQEFVDSISSTQGAAVTLFTCYLTELKPQTQYYVRAYAVIDCKYSHGTYRNVLLGGIEPFTTKKNQEIEEDKMPAPRNVSAQQAGGAVSITWNKPPEETYLLWYIVERNDSENDNYMVLGTTFYERFTDNTPLSGMNYYRVKTEARYPQKDSNYAYTEPCLFVPPTVEPPASLAAPTGVSAKQTEDYIELTWIAVEGANDYFIFRSSTENGIYEQLPGGIAGKSTSWIDNYPLNGDNYYKIKSVSASVPEGSTYSDYAYCIFIFP